MAGWHAACSESAQGVRVALRVTPRAGRNEIGTIRAGRLQVKVTAAPDAGQANTAVLKLISKAWHVPVSAMEIVSGESSREKLVLLHGIALSDLPPEE
jgi:uncharacterized protein